MTGDVILLKLALFVVLGSMINWQHLSLQDVLVLRCIESFFDELNLALINPTHPNHYFTFTVLLLAENERFFPQIVPVVKTYQVHPNSTTLKKWLISTFRSIDDGRHQTGNIFVSAISSATLGFMS